MILKTYQAFQLHQYKPTKEGLVYFRSEEDLRGQGECCILHALNYEIASKVRHFNPSKRIHTEISIEVIPNLDLRAFGPQDQPHAVADDTEKIQSNQCT